MRKTYHQYWTIKYPDGLLSAFELLSLFPYDARNKAKKKWRKSWPKLRKEGFECVPVIFKELKNDR